MNSEPGIALFDSGLGGVSVFNSLAKAFPHEKFYYLGDTARLPYGTKSPQTLTRYVQKNIEFLKQFPIKLLIVACNSASSVLDSMPIETDFPVWSVIPMGAAQALEKSKTKNMVLWATKTTIAQDKYNLFINSIDSQVTLLHQACPMLVPLVEENHIDHPATELFIDEYLKSFPKEADTLILGCTHYPFLINLLKRKLPSHVHIIESGEFCIKTLSQSFEHGDVKKNNNSSAPIHEFYLTDNSVHFQKICKNWIAPTLKIHFHSVDL